MIIDTTYLLPLARIEVKADLLKAIAEEKVDLDFNDLKVSLISLFELQAKASRKAVPAEYVAEAVEVILESFEVIPFYLREIIVKERQLIGLLRDYIDRVIVATAITQKEDLITEDSEIHSAKKLIEEKYKVKVLRFKDFVEK